MKIMQTFTKATAIALLLAATPLWAQDAGTQEPAAEEQPAAEAAAETATPDPDSGLSLGTPADQPDEKFAGRSYVSSEFSDWQLRCIRTGNDDPDPCQLYQLLKDGAGNDVAEFNLFALPPGGQAVAGANVITPLETLLTEQLTLAIDASKGKRYAFTFCTEIGCVARIGLTSADIASFKAGNAASVTLVPAGAPDQKVVLSLSLKGFTAGYTALEATLP